MEGVNNQLLLTLKASVDLLIQFKENAPDPEEWVEMLSLFQETIRAGEGVKKENRTHHH